MTIHDAIRNWQQNADVQCYLELKRQEAAVDDEFDLRVREIRELLEKMAELQSRVSLETLAEAAICAGEQILATRPE